MKCTKCGMELRETDAFCPNCGEPAPKNTGNNNDIGTQNTQERQTSNYNNYNYKQPQYQQYNKGNKILIIGIIIVAIIILVALIFGYVLIIKPVQDTIENNISESTSNNQSNEKNDLLNNNNSSSNNKSSSYKVRLSGFNFYIPDDLNYDVDYSSEKIDIGDFKSSWISQIQVIEGDFDTMEKKKDTLIPFLSDMFGETEAEFSNCTTETINGVKCIVLDATVSGVNMTIGIGKINSMYSALFLIINQENSFDRERINTISNIIDSAEYVGNTTNMEINEDDVLENLKDAFNNAVTENQ